MKKMIIAGTVAMFCTGIFMSAQSDAATKQQSRKKDGSCQVVSTPDEMTFAANKQRLRKKDGSCQTASLNDLFLAATKQHIRKKDGSCQSAEGITLAATKQRKKDGSCMG